MAQGRQGKGSNLNEKNQTNESQSDLGRQGEQSGENQQEDETFFSEIGRMNEGESEDQGGKGTGGNLSDEDRSRGGSE